MFTVAGRGAPRPHGPLAPGVALVLVSGVAFSLALGACSTQLPARATGSPVAGATARASAPGRASTPAPTPDPALFGAYRPEPVEVPAAIEQEAARQCRRTPIPGFVEEIGSRQVAVTDMRGMGVVLVVFADGGGATGCVVSVRPDGEMRARFLRVAGDAAKPLGAGAVDLWALEYPGGERADRTIAVGRYGDETASVRAEFDGERPVRATLRDGWYAMWWTGGRRPSRIVAITRAGTETGAISPP